MKIEWKRKLIYILFLPAGILLSYGASFMPGAVESVYSGRMFRIIGQALNIISGILPFSLAELLVTGVVVFSIWSLIHLVIKLLGHTHDKKSTSLNFLLNVLAYSAVIYFIFIVTWGLNYHRMPFANIAGLEVKPSSVKDLAALCDSLIDRANGLRKTVSQDKNGVMYIPDGSTGALRRAYKGYVNASKTYPELGGRFGRPKGVMLSELMSYSGITGVYFPYTGEANVNISAPDILLPSTAAHEMAHQRGFAREDEANYIAYLTCSVHPDADFEYSGVVLALLHSMDALYGYDPDEYMVLRKKYSEGINRDLASYSSYWKRYEGPVEKISNEINNTYLKANMQKDGVQSYGRMVDLLLAEYRLKSVK
jgi:hypothetical protein